MAELMTPAEVIAEAIPDENMDEGLLMAEMISRAERKYIRPALGVDLYEDVRDNPGAGNNPALVAFVKRALAHFTVYEALPNIWTHLSPQGLMSNQPDFSISQNRGTFAMFRDHYFSAAEFERQEMITFIEDNSGDYPLYSPDTDIREKGNKLIIY